MKIRSLLLNISGMALGLFASISNASFVADEHSAIAGCEWQHFPNSTNTTNVLYCDDYQDGQDAVMVHIKFHFHATCVLPYVAPEYTLAPLGCSNFELHKNQVVAAAIVNFSANGYVGTNENLMIAGFVLQGSVEEKILIRGLELPQAKKINDPRLTLFDGPSAIAHNDDWWASMDASDQNASPSSISSATSKLGISQLKGEGQTYYICYDEYGDELYSDYDDEYYNCEEDWSEPDGHSAAILKKLDEGLYSAHLNGSHNDTGWGQLEVFDTTSSNSDLTFINVSTRAYIDSSHPLSMSFEIKGSGQRKLLVRAVGPTQRVTYDWFHTDLKFEIRDSQGNLIASNNDWSTSTNKDLLRSAASQVGAFSLLENSKDAAVLVTLTQGKYTIITSSVSGTDNGVGLVEVYSVD